jgi:2-methylcitrate dehydratase PrpD
MKYAAHELAKFIVNTDFDSLPGDVVRIAKERIADVVGAGLSGSATQAAKIVDYIDEVSPPGKATIWGMGKSAAPEYAALANGTMTFHLELDDVHRTSHTHPGVCTVPAAIALCEEYGLSGKDLITAVVLGYDACIRVGVAVSPSIYVDRTFLAPGTLGPFGAAAVASKLLGLDVKQTAGAVGGASYTAPLACYESFRLGATVKDMIMGWDNFSGITMTRLAQKGFWGPDTSIEGDFGYCKSTSDRFDMSRFYNGLGEVYEITNTGVKPYACCRQHHAAIDCMLDIRKEHAITLEDVEKVLVRTFVVSSRGNKKDPDSIPAAKYSIPYIMAVTLEFGKAWRDQFTTQLLADGRIMNFASIVDVVADEELDKLYDEKWPSIVEVTLKSGKVVSARRDIPKGEPEFPSSTEDMKAKFMSLAGDVKSEEHCSKLWDVIFNIEKHPDMSKLAALL